MPPKRKADGPVPQSGLFIVAEYERSKKTLRRNANYAATISAVKKSFKVLHSTDSEEIMICTRLKESNNDMVQITEDLWPDLVPGLTQVTIMVDAPAPGPTRPVKQKNLNEARAVSTSKAREFTIYLRTLNGEEWPLRVSYNTVIQKVVDELATRVKIYCGDFSVLYDGSRITISQTAGDLHMKAEDEITAVPRMVGGKPVIYLFPPHREQNVHVRLSLVESWEFSAVYPPSAIESGATTNPHLGQTVSWTVDAHPNGTLFDKGCNREVSYLFWEAHTKPEFPLSPVSSRPGSPSGHCNMLFDPVTARVGPDNSALLPLDKVTAYIDDTLLALGLHAEARTSFITYWLPKFLAHRFIALRFVPQNEYETAAPMAISPAPDITTRVFMLFQGVNEADLEGWGPAEVRASKNTDIWRDIVGVDVERAMDVSLFRVLEWGGMEVK